MKTRIVALLLITAIGCSKSANQSKFAGSWNGSYRSTTNITNPPGFDTGTLHLTIDARNNASGILQSLHGGAPTTMQGTVDPSSGAISISKYGKGDYGIMVFLVALNGNLSLDSGSGTLAFPWASSSTWRAAKD